MHSFCSSPSIFTHSTEAKDTSLEINSLPNEIQMYGTLSLFTPHKLEFKPRIKTCFRILICGKQTKTTGMVTGPRKCGLSTHCSKAPEPGKSGSWGAPEKVQEQQLTAPRKREATTRRQELGMGPSKQETPPPPEPGKTKKAGIESHGEAPVSGTWSLGRMGQGQRVRPHSQVMHLAGRVAAAETRPTPKESPRGRPHSTSQPIGC